MNQPLTPMDLTIWFIVCTFGLSLATGLICRVRRWWK